MLGSRSRLGLRQCSMPTANFEIFFFFFFFCPDGKKSDFVLTAVLGLFCPFNSYKGGNLEIFYHVCITQTMSRGDLESCYFSSWQYYCRESNAQVTASEVTTCLRNLLLIRYLQAKLWIFFWRIVPSPFSLIRGPSELLFGSSVVLLDTTHRHSFGCCAHHKVEKSSNKLPWKTTKNRDKSLLITTTPIW